MVGVFILPPQTAQAATALDDITHLDFETPKTAADWRVTTPTSVIKDASRGSSKRSSSRSPVSKSSYGRIAGKMRVTKGVSALNTQWGNNPSTWPEPSKQGAAARNVIAQTKAAWKAPATPLNVLGKVGKATNVVGAVMLGGDLGFALGKEVSGALGFNVDGTLCNPGFEDGGLIAAVTSADCSKWNEFDGTYNENGDRIPGMTGPASCVSGKCVSLTGAHLAPYSNPGTYQKVHGFSSTGYAGVDVGSSTAAPYLYVKVNGNWLSSNKSSVNGTGTTARFCATVTGSSVPSSGVFCATAALNSTHPDYNLFFSEYLLKSTASTPTAATSGAKVTETDLDPSRIMRCTIAGATGGAVSAVSSAYKESGGVIPNPVCPAVPDGMVPGKVTVTEEGQGVTATEPLYEENTTDAYKKWAADFPECQTGMCILDMYKLDGTKKKTCFVDPYDRCVGWFEDPQRDEKYSCEYAGKSISLTECYIYAEIFNTPQTSKGEIFYDPDTGTTSPTPEIGSGKAQFAKDGVKPKDFEDCWPTGWNVFNPALWVAQPIQCVAVWAFVPRDEVVSENATRMFENWAEAPPGKLGTVMTAWEFVPPSSGCGGVTVGLEFLPEQIRPGGGITFFNACPGDLMEPYAGFVKILLTLAICVAATFSVVQSVEGIVGYRGGIGS